MKTFFLFTFFVSSIFSVDSSYLFSLTESDPAAIVDGKGNIITNTDGDMILMKGDKKIRFDVKDPHGEVPHFHLEKKNPDGKWVDNGAEHRYYFSEE